MIGKFYKKYIFKKFRLLPIILTLISIINTLINIIFPYLLREIINHAASKNFPKFKLNVLIFSGLWILSLILMYVYSIGLEKIRVIVKSTLRIDAIKSILRDVGIKQKESTGNYLQILVDDVEKVEDIVIEPYLELMSVFLLGFGALYFMIKISPVLTLISISPVPLYLFFTILYQKRASRLAELRQNKFQKVVNFMEEIIKNKNLIRNFLWTDSIIDTFNTTYNEYINSYMNLFRTNVIFGKLINFLLSVSVQLSIIVVGAYLVLRGNIQPGGVVAFILYVNYVKSPMQYILSFKVRIEPAKVSLSRIWDIISAKTETRTSIPVKKGDEKLIFSVRDLTFSYEGENKIIENFSLEIKDGSWTCIIGETGAGKSTLLYILLGQLKPQRGKICFMGNDINTMSTDDILEYVTIVEQEPLLLSNFTVRENLLITNETDWQYVVDISKKIGMGDFIKNLDPDLIVGHEASNLSGGEKKRLSILRGVLRDTPVIIFDEPTAYLDEKTAKNILISLKKYLKNKTIIIVTHDRFVLETCEEVINLSNYEVREDKNNANNIQIS